MADDEALEIVEAEYTTELVPSAGAPPATLFHTDDPVEIVTKATVVADALSDVLRKKKLTNRISDKDYVKVEGWTLCGTMLGVFPVVEWTRPIEGGWEARVEAKTRDGSVVGAAEAECLRSEKRWKTADDYSIRSMAQTRAISKALRAPLGFIVALAGYETTPEEEMVRSDSSPAEPSAPKPFDPNTDLLPGAISGQGATKRIGESLRGIDGTVDWGVLFESIDPAWRKLKGQESADFWRRASNAEHKLAEKFPSGTLPPPTDKQIQEAFAFAFSGQVVMVEYVEVKEPAPLSEEQVAKIEETLADPADDPGFGYENPND